MGGFQPLQRFFALAEGMFGLEPCFPKLGHVISGSSGHILDCPGARQAPDDPGLSGMAPYMP